MSGFEEVGLDAPVSNSSFPKYKGKADTKDRIAIPTLRIYRGYRWYVEGLGYIKCSDPTDRSHPLFELEGDPQERFIVPVVHYVTDTEGKPRGKELLYDIKVWDFSPSKYSQLKDASVAAQEMKDTEDPRILEKVDLFVKCVDEGWQKLEITPTGKALWSLKKAEILEEIEKSIPHLESLLSREVPMEKILEHYGKKTEEEEDDSGVTEENDVESLLDELV